MLGSVSGRDSEWGRLIRQPDEIDGLETQSAYLIVSDADAVYGQVGRDLLAAATKLRWIQSPAIGLERTMYPELIAHPVVVTNFREIYSDHIGAHIMMYVLNFARGMQRFFRQQEQCEWKKPPRDTGSGLRSEHCARPSREWLGLLPLS